FRATPPLLHSLPPRRSSDLTGLLVLERDVVDRLALRERVSDALEDLGGHGADVDRLDRRPHRLGEGDRVRLGVVARREPGHRVGDRKSTRLNSSHVKISYAV